jgi:predicted ATP-grasp superfamily ATP-dependent carboligase
MKRSSRPPVVLLGGLNIMRALGRARIPVIIASSERRTPSMASRFCCGVLPLPPLAERDAVVEALVREGRRLAAEHGTRVPLFYDNDDRLALVQACRAALAPHFALLLNEPQLGEALLDKTRFQSLAEEKGLPVPRRIAWDALEDEAGPLLVKPRTRLAFQGSSVHQMLFGGAGKARVFASGREAKNEPLVRRLAGLLAFQEYVPGGDDTIWSFHGFAAPGGEVLEWFVGRKIRTYPELTGDSSYLGLARDESLVALGRDIAARLGLAGVFKMDFKRSSSSGRWYLLEINTRFNLWHYLGATSGVNLPQVAYEFLVDGRRPVHAEAKLGYRWLCLRYDWPAYRELHAQRKLGLAQWLWSLAAAPKVYDLFAWSDPMPLARVWNERARRLPRGLRRRVGRWLSTAS